MTLAVGSFYRRCEIEIQAHLLGKCLANMPAPLYKEPHGTAIERE